MEISDNISQIDPIFILCLLPWKYHINEIEVELNMYPVEHLLIINVYFLYIMNIWNILFCCFFTLHMINSFMWRRRLSYMRIFFVFYYLVQHCQKPYYVCSISRCPSATIEWWLGIHCDCLWRYLGSVIQWGKPEIEWRWTLT